MVIPQHTESCQLVRNIRPVCVVLGGSCDHSDCHHGRSGPATTYNFNWKENRNASRSITGPVFVSRVVEGDRIRFDRVCASFSSGDLTTTGACRVHSCRAESGSVGPFACEGARGSGFPFYFLAVVHYFFLLGQGDKKGLTRGSWGSLSLHAQYIDSGVQDLFGPTLPIWQSWNKAWGSSGKGAGSSLSLPPSVGPVGSGRKSWGQTW